MQLGPRAGGPHPADPSRRAARWLSATAALFLAMPALLTLELSGDALLFAWGFGLLLAALSLLMLHVVRSSGRLQVRQIEALLSGAAWVSWEYGDQEWEEFVTAGQKQARRSGARLLLAVGAGTLLLTLLVAVAAGDPVASLWVAAAGALAALLLWGVQRVHAGRSFSGRFRQVLIGPCGAYLTGPPGSEDPGRFHQWQGSGLEVRSVTLKTGDPQVLEVEVSGAGMTSHEVCLPVPRGHEQEARELVGRLGQRIGSADLVPGTDFEAKR